MDTESRPTTNASGSARCRSCPRGARGRRRTRPRTPTRGRGNKAARPTRVRPSEPRPAAIQRRCATFVLADVLRSDDGSGGGGRGERLGGCKPPGLLLRLLHFDRPDGPLREVVGRPAIAVRVVVFDLALALGVEAQELEEVVHVPQALAGPEAGKQAAKDEAGVLQERVLVRFLVVLLDRLPRELRVIEDRPRVVDV